MGLAKSGVFPSTLISISQSSENPSAKTPSLLPRSTRFPPTPGFLSNSFPFRKKYASVPGPILEIGNTNNRYRFGMPARQFVNAWNAHGPAHHCAVGLGHLASKIDKLGKLLGVEVAQVC